MGDIHSEPAEALVNTANCVRDRDGNDGGGGGTGQGEGIGRFGRVPRLGREELMPGRARTEAEKIGGECQTSMREI